MKKKKYITPEVVRIAVDFKQMLYATSNDCSGQTGCGTYTPPCSNLGGCGTYNPSLGNP